MESADVIHSFWVPEFRVKQDVVPGRVTEYRITPTLIGDYKVRCAELCGSSHAYMESPVIVDSQADYDCVDFGAVGNCRRSRQNSRRAGTNF